MRIRTRLATRYASITRQVSTPKKLFSIHHQRARVQKVSGDSKLQGKMSQIPRKRKTAQQSSAVQSRRRRNFLVRGKTRKSQWRRPNECQLQKSFIRSTWDSEAAKTIIMRTLRISPFFKRQMVAKLFSLKKIPQKPDKAV